MKKHLLFWLFAQISVAASAQTVSVTVTISYNGPQTTFGVTVDGVSVPFPHTYNWIPGSTHTIAVANSVQGPFFGGHGAGSRYVWSSWSDGGAVSHTVIAPAADTTYTAAFDTQYALFLDVPPEGMFPECGTMDAIPTSPDGFYAVGTIVQVTATACPGSLLTGITVDSNLPTTINPINVSMDGPHQVLGSILGPDFQIRTKPANLAYLLDGVAYSGIQSFAFPKLSVHTVSAGTGPVTASDGLGYVFSNWSDNGALSHQITVFGQDNPFPQMLTANFVQCPYTLATKTKNFAAPGGAGTLNVQTLPGCSWNAGSTVPWMLVTAVGSPGSGDVQFTVAPNSGVTRSGVINIANGLTLTVTQFALPTVTLSPAPIYFGYNGSLITSPQQLGINFNVSLASTWTATTNAANISVSPASGVGNGIVTVTATPGSSGVLTVSAPLATNGPAQLLVNVAAVSIAPPFGSFDTPASGTTGIAGAIPVTGWALDNIEVTKVDLWREPVSGETPTANGLVYIGDTTFVDGARPDVAASYPTTPRNSRGGWGYLLLTNELPNSGGLAGTGNGVYKLHAIAHNSANLSTDLGVKVITVDNVHASKPFGTIDTPTPGGTASGNNFVNFGWALTQNPYFIPMDGSTITVYVDGQALGHPVYNQFRNDIATAFPGLANSNGAVGYYVLDTTALSNGIHTISWIVYDNQGRGDGVGSRFFSVANNTPTTTESLGGAIATNQAPRSQEVEELDRIEIPTGAIYGFSEVRGDHLPLPSGSTLKDGAFYWQLGPGFLGTHHLVFVQSDGTEVPVDIDIRPKRFRSSELK